MVKLLQSQSTVSHPTHMQVYGGSNCQAFGDKHLFYALFVITTSVHVADGYTFSAASVGFLPVCSQVPQHSTHWINPTVTPHTTQIPSSSALSKFMAWGFP